MVWPHFTSLISALGLGVGGITMPCLSTLTLNGTTCIQMELVSVFFHVLKPSNAWDMLVPPLLYITHVLHRISYSYIIALDMPLVIWFSFSSYCYWPHHNLFLVFAPLVPYWHWSSLPCFLSSLILIKPIMGYLFWVDTECSCAFHLLVWTFVLPFVQNFICYIRFYRFYFLVINWKMHCMSLRRPASVLLQPSLSGKTMCHLESHPLSEVTWYL